jgi:hypothetical protein
MHINRELIGQSVLTTNVTLNIDTVTAKISVNDIVLANSILSKVNNKSIESQNKSTDSQNEGRTRRSSTISSNLVPIQTNTAVDSTVYDLLGQLGSFTLVFINDFNTHIKPVVRLSLERTDFRAGIYMDTCIYMYIYIHIYIYVYINICM